MTTDTIQERMEQALLCWGAWLQGGRRQDGYPVTNVLHESWLPPTGGIMPTMVTSTSSDRRERALHEAVRSMSQRMQNTLVVVYVWRAPPSEWEQHLQCAPGTVRQRIAQAKRELLRCVQGF